ncbi:MAG: hypothetical protein KDD61_13610, partial [Bdellovibrionales bacterium]|nr:hypothetical protein [Bdellovibrionales bacterium]
NCSAESNRCYQMVHIGPFFFSEHSNSEWTFGQGSVFKWQDGRKSLLKGALTVTSPSVVEIEAGSATVSHFGGRILVKRESESTLIFNISSSVVVTPLGKKVGFDLPRGFSVRVNNVGISGVAQADIIEAVRVKNLLKEWGRLATDELRFRQEVLAFRQDWRRAVELASEWQKTSVERKIASYEAEQQRRRLLREKRERENQALRQLFREKTGF